VPLGNVAVALQENDFPAAGFQVRVGPPSGLAGSGAPLLCGSRCWVWPDVALIRSAHLHLELANERITAAIHSTAENGPGTALDRRKPEHGIEAIRGKRILFVFCSLELGGAERQGMHLARYLKNLGCDVRVWGHLGHGLVEQECDEAGIPWAIHRFLWPCRKSSLVRDGWRVLRALRRDRPDVILPYTAWANMSCGLTWRLSPAKVCIWSQRNVHDMRGHPLERFAYRRVSAVVCNAAHEVDYLRRTLGETPAPVSIVHNGVELVPRIRTRAAWREELGVGEDTTVAAMVANFRSVKDHPTLLHAWRKVLAATPAGQSRPRLLLAGAPQDSYDAVRQLASSLGLLDTVHFLGQIKDISGLLAATDIGILASNHEGLPNVVIEYMAGGLPVVATDLPGTREALGDDSQQQLCKLGDPDSLAGQLQALLNEPDLRRQLGMRNQRRAAQEFSVDKMCQTTADLISDLLGGHAATGRACS